VRLRITSNAINTNFKKSLLEEILNITIIFPTKIFEGNGEEIKEYTCRKQKKERSLWIKLLIKTYCFGEPLAHTCNPIYSRGRDQEDHSLKPAWENSS
jgi:hypothetical protein